MYLDTEWPHYGGKTLSMAGLGGSANSLALALAIWPCHVATTNSIGNRLPRHCSSPRVTFLACSLVSLALS